MPVPITTTRSLYSYYRSFLPRSCVTLLRPSLTLPAGSQFFALQLIRCPPSFCHHRSPFPLRVLIRVRCIDSGLPFLLRCLVCLPVLHITTFWFPLLPFYLVVVDYPVTHFTTVYYVVVVCILRLVIITVGCYLPCSITPLPHVRLRLVACVALYGLLPPRTVCRAFDLIPLAFYPPSSPLLVVAFCSSPSYVRCGYF